MPMSKGLRCRSPRLTTERSWASVPRYSWTKAHIALGPVGAGLEPMTTGQSIVGPYHIDNYNCQSYGVLTNKCPGGAYRGVGTVQGIFVIERIMDMIAQNLNMDPAEVRRRNLIQSHEMPYNTAAGRLYDSGDYVGTLDRVLELSEYHELRTKQAEARANGEWVGIGIACFVEHTSTGSMDYRRRGVVGNPGFDAATIRVDARGNVLVGVSARSSGQGHEAVFGSLAAREIGVPYETVKVLQGDTDSTPFGTGTGVSRSAVSTGGAIRLAAQDIRRKVFEVARFFLDSEDEELDIANGQVFVKSDPDRTVPFTTVAGAAYNGSREVVLPEAIERGLHATRSFDPPHQVFGNGAHIALVRVDRETGLVKLEQYFIVEDCGTILDHVIVDGQVVGGAAQGVGKRLVRGTAVRRGRPANHRFVDGLLGAHRDGHAKLSSDSYGNTVAVHRRGSKGCGRGRHCRSILGGSQRRG